MINTEIIRQNLGRYIYCRTSIGFCFGYLYDIKENTLCIKLANSKNSFVDSEEIIELRELTDFEIERFKQKQQDLGGNNET